MTKKEFSKKIDERVKKLDEMQATYNLVGEVLEKYCDKVILSVDKIIAEVLFNYDKLKELQYILDAEYGIKLIRTSIWEGYEDSQMLAAFENHNKHLDVWLRFDPDNPPKELIMGCHIKTEKEEVIRRTLVCDV